MTVTTDATSGKPLPQNASEWTTLLASAPSIGIGAPFFTLLMQDASGNLTDVINSIVMTKTGSPTYQNSVSGWAAKSILCRGGQADGFSSTSASLPTISTTSVMTFVWCDFPASMSTNGSFPPFVFMWGTPYISQAGIVSSTSTKPAAAFVNSGGGVGAATNSHASAQHPILLQLNRATTKVNFDSDLENNSTTFGQSMAGRLLWIGGNNGAESNNAAGVPIFYMAAWSGADAEIDATKRAALVSLMNSTYTPPTTGYSRGRSVNEGGLGSGVSRGRVVNREARLARDARAVTLPWARSRESSPIYLGA